MQTSGFLRTLFALDFASLEKKDFEKGVLMIDKKGIFWFLGFTFGLTRLIDFLKGAK